jgi:hypothetical protein
MASAIEAGRPAERTGRWQVSLADLIFMLAWTLSMAVVALFILELSLARAGRPQPVPFDAVAQSPGRRARFLWLTAALTTVCLAALPTLAVLSQAIIDIRFHIDRWMTFGWPSPF